MARGDTATACTRTVKLGPSVLIVPYRNPIVTAKQLATVDQLARYDVENPKALRRLVDEHGVTMRAYSDDILQAAWRESNAYLEEQAAADATFRRVYESWNAYRQDVFPYFAGNEQSYARFAFDQVPGSIPIL